MLPTFFESYKERTANIPHLRTNVHSRERDRQFNIKKDLEKHQASFDYLLSDNPACGGRILSEERKLQPRDNRNLLRCKSEQVETLKNKISDDNSRFTKTTGKLQTGLTCHHKFNADTLHFKNTGIEKNTVDNFVQDMGRAMTKFSATFPILSATKSSKSRKREESSAKTKRRKAHAAEARKKKACFIFLSF